MPSFYFLILPVLIVINSHSAFAANDIIQVVQDIKKTGQSKLGFKLKFKNGTLNALVALIPPTDSGRHNLWSSSDFAGFHSLNFNIGGDNLSKITFDLVQWLHSHGYSGTGNGDAGRAIIIFMSELIDHYQLRTGDSDAGVARIVGMIETDPDMPYRGSLRLKGSSPYSAPEPTREANAEEPKTRPQEQPERPHSESSTSHPRPNARPAAREYSQSMVLLLKKTVGETYRDFNIVMFKMKGFPQTLMARLDGTETRSIDELWDHANTWVVRQGRDTFIQFFAAVKSNARGLENVSQAQWNELYGKLESENRLDENTVESSFTVTPSSKELVVPHERPAENNEPGPEFRATAAGGSQNQSAEPGFRSGSSGYTAGTPPQAAGSTHAPHTQLPPQTIADLINTLGARFTPSDGARDLIFRMTNGTRTLDEFVPDGISGPAVWTTLIEHFPPARMGLFLETCRQTNRAFNPTPWAWMGTQLVDRLVIFVARIWRQSDVQVEQILRPYILGLIANDRLSELTNKFSTDDRNAFAAEFADVPTNQNLRLALYRETQASAFELNHHTAPAAGDAAVSADVQINMVALRKAFMDSFNGRSNIEQLLMFKVEKRLDTIAGNDNLTVVWTKVINTAIKENWIDDLIAGALEANPRGFGMRLEAVAPNYKAGCRLAFRAITT